MGSPTIWYYPDEDGTLETVTLPHVTRIVELPLEESASVRSLAGVSWVRRFASARRIRVVVDAIEFSRAAVESLQALESHVNAGGMVGFARDSDTAWAGVTQQLPKRGDSLIRADPIALYNTSAAIPEDGELVIESASPERRSENNTLSSIGSDGALSLNRALIHSYTERPIIIRQRDFYPAMQRSPDTIGGAMLTTQRRLVYSLDLVLDEVADGVLSLANAARVAGSSPSSRLRTLPELVREIRWKTSRGMRRP